MKFSLILLVLKLNTLANLSACNVEGSVLSPFIRFVYLFWFIGSSIMPTPYHLLDRHFRCQCWVSFSHWCRRELGLLLQECQRILWPLLICILKRRSKCTPRLWLSTFETPTKLIYCWVSEFSCTPKYCQCAWEV